MNLYHPKCPIRNHDISNSIDRMHISVFDSKSIRFTWVINL